MSLATGELSLQGLPRVEYAQPGDEYFNYCLWPYQPVCATEGKLAASALYYHTLQLAGVGPVGLELVDRLRGAIGPMRTVFGVKMMDGRFGWELYFYDYERRKRARSLAKVLQALEPMVQCRVPNVERLPYFMFSLDMGPLLLEGATELHHVNLYLGNVGSAVSSGVSYKLTPTSRTLENFYFFFDAQTDLATVVGKASCSAYIEQGEIDYAEIVWPELADCRTICYANKRTHDCIYFSEVTVHQLLFFLERLKYPHAVIDFIAANRPRLDHLLFDVGYDFTYDENGLHFLKSGYYGVF